MYIHVSYLHFRSKLIERCVASRLDKHMKNNTIESKYQYGYKKGHSMEMLLIIVAYSFLIAFDNTFAIALLLLDLSAAFDTVGQDYSTSYTRKLVPLEPHTDVSYPF